MRFIGNLLRFYSYIFEVLVSLLALATGAVIVASPHHTVNPGWLPWSPESVGKWLVGIGIAGLLLVVLAFLNRLRFLLTLFAIAVCWLLLKGFFLSGWRFSGPDDFHRSILFTLGAFVAIIGSIPWPEPRTRKYKSRP